MEAVLDSPLSVPSTVNVGIDVGSTTTKAVVVRPGTDDVLYSEYKRHGGMQAKSVRAAIGRVAERFAGAIRMVVSGSGAAPIAERLGVPFIQEVVANACAVRTRYPEANCAIELGGQDAKMVFFRRNTTTGQLEVADMRMNGSCAGGTGAFIDEVASLLKVPVEQFNELASRGTTLYEISGRCGVYAKTDIQPLLNQGVPREDLALSSLHAIAKQTIGGLAQGLRIEAPVIFEGGPLTFNPRLVEVFAERLNLGEDEVIRPESPETIVALGAALSLDDMFADADATIDSSAAMAELEIDRRDEAAPAAKPYFVDKADKIDFELRHGTDIKHAVPVADGVTHVRAYLGIDSGSTTTKFALIDERERLIDEFYANNEGEPLDIARDALIDLRERYRKRGIDLEIVACGTTGYGELLFNSAFHADYHTVETVAHAEATRSYVPDASFILDIGGQDMKAIWLEDGVVKDIVVNEACSSGCGSFLENFAGSLGIETKEIARAAFRSDNPAALGSRCTVFMNSSIITEQRNGKGPDDIMAGLCRSIVENVFTKVIRVANLDSLGNKIVVQGGTFNNDAVLRALEQYLGKNVTRAPYPGLMGAIGVARLTKRDVENKLAAGKKSFRSTFIGLDSLEDFSYTQRSNLTCPFCANHCNRTLVSFSDGSSWVTGNRCPRGEVVGDPKDAEVRERARRAKARVDQVPNLFETRKRLLFKDRKPELLCEKRDMVIGIPRVLSFWDTMPFWDVFWRSLGFTVRISRMSTREMYERGLPSVASDTVCFPAKLVHGHILELVDRKVDRIFMPIITTVHSENTEKTSESMCAIVKGYPMVVRTSDDPEERYGIPFDTPLFHWYTDRDRDCQLTAWMEETFGIPAELTRKAIAAGDVAQKDFKDSLVAEGSRVIEQVEEGGGYAVVLASRPYHNDDLVNHDLPGLFTEMGIPVLTPDSVPGIEDVDLHNARIDIVNNYHARMISTAILAARNPHLEYAQVVSFGCGHDAYLSDEIIRVMRETSNDVPLVLKVDESDATGPLRIRVRSFVETLNMRHASESEPEVHELPDPYPQKFTKADRKERVVLIPNTSHAFSRLMAAAFAAQGVRTEPLPLGREEAIRLGKKYVHNDICFPAQITIGEALAELETGKYDNCEVAIGMGKYVGDCRLTHYAPLLRKALDDAGYEDVPIITNDDVDYHDMQPGFKMNIVTALKIAIGLPMIDALEALLRKMRPYELEPGSADAAFEEAITEVVDGLRHHGIHGEISGFKRAIKIMERVKYDRSESRPTVLIVGEYLLNFHPGANHDIERYLEDNGLEIIEARMTDVIRKTYFYKDSQIKEYHVDKPLSEKVWYAVADKFFDIAHDITDRIGKEHPLYEAPTRMPELVKASDPIMHHTFDAGEGVLIPAEILHNAEHGCRAFIILGPFGCLPNHVAGRGIAGQLKRRYPDAQILALDYDPDVSQANIENRLQMLVMNAKDAAAKERQAASNGADAAPAADEQGK